MNRRDFLKRIIKSFSALIGLLFVLSIAYLSPLRLKRKTLRFFPVLDEDELPQRGVRRVGFSYESRGREVKGYAFVVPEEGRWIAFSPVCTHLGCFVTWDNNRKEFLCPCHGGRYTMRGEVASGPPPRPLTRLPIEVREGKVYIGIAV